jgi:hypothetical protein
MSDEPKFVAKVIKNVPVAQDKNKGLAISNFLPPMKKVAPEIPTIDLSSINAAQLRNNLQGLLNDQSLTNNTFIFTSKRYNKKLELERDRVDIVLGLVDRAIELNRNIINYNVDIFLTQKRMEQIAFRHAVDMEREARAIIREEELQAKMHLDNLDKVNDDYRLRQLTIEEAELKNEKLRLENARLKAQTDEARAKIDFIREVLGQVSVKNMPSTLQAYITATIINPNGTQFNDFDMQEQLKQYVIKEAEYNAKMTGAKARQEESQADVAEATARKTKEDIDRIRNKPKS